MPLADYEIRALCQSDDLITPFIDKKTGNPSYGLSSYGYDLTLGAGFIEYRSTTKLLDPIQLDPAASFKFNEWEFIILMPGQFILAHTVETVRMPNNLLGKICDKSTLARCGIDVKNTVIEPGFVGQITLEITNGNNIPVKLHVGKGIAQIIFYPGEPCETPYGETSKYQNQTGVTLPK